MSGREDALSRGQLGKFRISRYGHGVSVDRFVYGRYTSVM